MIAASRDDEGSESSTQVSASARESGGDATPAEPAPSLDVVFDVLRNRRRRLVLTALEDADGTTTLGELAEHIGGIENDKPPESLNSQERKRVYVGLYQSHLPKMDDAGAVRFDDDRGTVERGPQVEEFHRYLDDDARAETPTGYYLGIAAASVLGFAVSLFASQPVAAVTIVLLIALVGVAGARATG